MKYFFIAGEASGDLHASHLMRELKKEDPQAEFRYFGGDLMEAEGGTLLKHYREMAYMGFITVVRNLDKIKANFKLAEAELLAWKPDVLVLVDYPGFNLRMARFAKEHSIRTYYYISPKIWAWKTKRVKKVKKFIDEMFTIFPFETEFYAKYDYPVRYVGNPTVDELAVRPNQDETFDAFVSRNQLSGKPLIALLAGSRKQEINNILPVMTDAAARFPEYEFVLAGAPSQPEEFYRQVLKGKEIPIVFNQTYELLQQSKAALVASGTATLETAVLNIPQVVCYKMELGKIARWGRPFLLKIPYFSLVNLIVDREIVTELFQDHCTVDTVSTELKKILDNKSYREKMLAGYDEMRQRLGEPGCAARAAKQMVELLK
ncbi:lipid-A-disaccharide synthase [Prolixibacter bellariivorans]|uniref:Lipid-A-disaccharide synthase n=1 Tax=Prolixibacter bellariivorans TaxID=314319 RepID=A0A5M4B0B4_9BACT|nr:lipid-A-disaccharide synthase [Prolixibacter bellariivorans]GET33316.1 lipid-A-disaccharide synthase [Prolixibacter bellariivorans]